MDKAEKLFLKNVEEYDMDFWSILRLYQMSYHDVSAVTERNLTSYAISGLFRRLEKLGITPEVLRNVEDEFDV